MIDFRYHIVSIAAVFLALALGLVLGSTAGFQNNAISDLDSKISNLRKANNDLRTSVERERGLVKRNDQLIGVIAPELLAGTLSGEEISVVSAPGASGSLRGDLEQAIQAAGGTVVSAVELDASFFDQASAAVLSGLVDRLAPSAPTTGSAVERGAAALSAALLVDDGSRAGAALSTSGTALLAGLAEAKLLKLGASPKRASLVVMLAADPADVADPTLTGLVTVAKSLCEAGRGCVVVGDEGPGAAPHGLIRQVRTDSLALAEVSTVDDSTTAAGRFRMIRALLAERAGLVGQYGVGDGADEVVATPSPSP